MTGKFKLKLPEQEDKQPIIRLKPAYYQLISDLKTQTGLSMGNIVEQCIDYAMANMEVEAHHA